MKICFSILFIVSSLSTFAQEVDFRKKDPRQRGNHRVILTSSLCEEGSSDCKAMDREGIVRLEISARKYSEGNALYLYNKLGKTVTVLEDDSQLIAFVGQLRIEMKEDPDCKLELILNEANEIKSSIVKCP